MLINLFSLREEELKKWLIDNGEKPFHAAQIFNWLYKKYINDFEEMTDMSVTLRKKLSNAFFLNTLKLETTKNSSDKETIKFLWRLSDGSFVESVLIYAPKRVTLCVSSQVGCPVRCSFCASGKRGFIRNLEVEEIVEQAYYVNLWLQNQSQSISHVVYMGMGEPLENYDNVVKSIEILNYQKGLNISKRRITLSTVGVIEGIKRLTKDNLRINLALSLHAPNQEIRKKIIPYARRNQFNDLFNALKEFSFATKRDVTYEYILIKGINDKKEHAIELAELLKNEQCTVNLIPYNPIEGVSLSRPSKETIDVFQKIIFEKGINITWRYTKGKDIAAACGQLALQRTLG
jgi:23S rRNA (adenine2503-C2)-methyltransferase